MHVAVALLLIASTSSVPELAPLPEGLPPAVMTPCEDCCKEPGVFLPLIRADAVDLQRQQCKVLPDRFRLHVKVLEAEKELARTEGYLKGVEDAQKTPWTTWLTAGTVGAIIGVLTGIIVGLEVTR